MLSILKTINLTSIEYNNFIHWLSQLADNSITAEGEIFKSIINLMIHIWNKGLTSAIILKYLMYDYKQIISEAMDQSIDFEVFLEPKTSFLNSNT